MSGERRRGEETLGPTVLSHEDPSTVLSAISRSYEANSDAPSHFK